MGWSGSMSGLGSVGDSARTLSDASCAPEFVMRRCQTHQQVRLRPWLTCQGRKRSNHSPISDWDIMRCGHVCQVGFQRVRILHLLATGLLAHLPLQGRNAACGTATSHETNWRVTNLDFVRDIKDLNLGIELLSLAKGFVRLVDHNITTTRHVLFVKTLDVEANIVTGFGLLGALVVHLDCEHLTPM